MSGQAYREMALAEMAHSTTFFGNVGLERARRLALLPEDSDQLPSAQQSGLDRLLVQTQRFLLRASFERCCKCS